MIILMENHEDQYSDIRHVMRYHIISSQKPMRRLAEIAVIMDIEKKPNSGFVSIAGTNAHYLRIEKVRTNVNEALIRTWQYSLERVYLKMSSIFCSPFCSDINMSTLTLLITHFSSSQGTIF